MRHYCRFGASFERNATEEQRSRGTRPRDTVTETIAGDRPPRYGTITVTEGFLMKRFAELQTSLNARPHAARTFTRSVDTAPHLKPPPPLPKKPLTLATLGGKTNWRDTSTPSLGENILSLNGHTLKTCAPLKRAYPRFARARCTRDTRFTPRLPSRPEGLTAWEQPRGVFRVPPRPHRFIASPSEHTHLSEHHSERCPDTLRTMGTAAAKGAAPIDLFNSIF